MQFIDVKHKINFRPVYAPIEMEHKIEVVYAFS